MTNYLQLAQNLQSNLTDWRRDFHQNPELGFEEFRTAGIVAEYLRQLGIEVRTGLGVTGVVGVIRGHQDGPVVMMRFDMDALPIQEENTTEYRSQVPGKFHGCAHDGHTAMGMGVATLLSQYSQDFCGTVLLVFQPAEEKGAGAKAMIADGAISDPRPDYALGIHLHSQTPAGVFQIGDGPILSAADSFKAEIIGRGGHGAEPHATVDATIVAAYIVTQLQTIISRNIDPLDMAVVSIGSLHSGDTHNVISERAILQGSIRTYRPETRSLVHKRVREIIECSAAAMGAKGQVTINELLPATVNHPTVSARMREVVSKLVGWDKITTDQQSTPSDDMAYFSQEAPGCYLVLGAARCENDYPHHNPKFDWDESVMPLGVAAMCMGAIELLPCKKA